MKKKVVSMVLSVCLLVNITPAWSADASEPQLVGTAPITAGATLSNYTWETVDGPIKLSVMALDLTNPYLKVDVIPGEGKFTQRTIVSSMAHRTGAVGAINGDFYNTLAEGAPIGATVINGEFVSSPSVIEGIYALGISEDNTASINQFTFSGSVTAANSKAFALAGLNKAVYWNEPWGAHSHKDQLHLYSDMWGGLTRGQDEYTTDLAEVLIRDNKVIAISPTGYFNYQVPDDSYILRGDGLAKAYLMENFQVGDQIKMDYQLSPDQKWKMVIGGHGMLVDNGQIVPYTKDLSALKGVRARTAVGISENGKILYLVAAEGRTAASKGITLGNLSLFMTKIGIWDGLNLDGGGSTTMVTRPLGEFTATQTLAVESNFGERRVVEALGVFSTAPAGGALKGLMLTGANRLLVGESSTYNLKAYDDYYNPVVTSSLPAQYSDSASLGAWQNNVYTPTKSGKTQLRVASGGVNTTIDLEVLGKESIKSMVVTADKTALVEGGTAQLQASVVLNDGTTKMVSPSALTWLVEGFTGTVSPTGLLTLTSNNGNTAGKVTADYEGFKSSLDLGFEKTDKVHLLNSLEGITFDKSPATTTGGVSLVADPANSSNQVVKLEYNYGQAKESVAAYLNFAALPISINAKNLYLDVYGSGKGEWLRLELTDGTGAITRYDLATQVDWQGWKQVSLNLADLKLTGPLSVHRIYAVELANANRNQTAPNSLLFRNMKVLGDTGASGAGSIQLQIGSKKLLKDNQEQLMDVAPMAVNNRTMVPTRFIVEALGGQVTWEQDTQSAVILYNGTLVEVPLGQKVILVNGQSVAIDTQTQAINERIMLPLRAIAENLGMKVDYTETTQTITITP